jgi:uncharacterized protein (UPF0303 family)
MKGGNLMTAVDNQMKEVEEQEKRLQFQEFTSETALNIGMSLVERAKAENKVITIDITRNGHQLFHYAFEGTSPDNDQWVLRKNRVVNRFNTSSLHFRLKLESSGSSLAAKQLEPTEYAASGGAFPIIIRNVGVVGTITVSGLADTEDHAIVAWAINNYLTK